MPELAAHLERAKELVNHILEFLDEGQLAEWAPIAQEAMVNPVAAALAACARESRNEALWDAAETARRTPFRCHAKDDVDFHSGCVQTQERIVDAIRKLRAERAVGEKGSK